MSSYIFFTRAADADEVNDIIEENGYGPNSLSVHLVSTTDQTQWRGAHSFVNLLVPQPRYQQLVITEYYESGEPIDNWTAALAANDLEQPEVTAHELPGTNTAADTGEPPIRPAEPDVQLRPKRNRKAKSKAKPKSGSAGS